MRSAMIKDVGDIGVVERDVTEPPPGWVRVRVTSAGICGTDLHFLDGSLGNPAGIRPGHEVAGVVEAVGEGGTMAPGTHVAVEPIIGCGTCVPCRGRRPNLCLEIQTIGVHHPGGLADHVDAPESALHELPPALPAAAAAFSEPMAVCVRAMRIGQIDATDRVAIIGAGTIGLLSVLTARQAGAAEVTIAARHPHQQELARRLGADAVFATSEELTDAVGPDHVDAVVETVGGEAETLAEATAIARRGGRIVVLGLFSGDAALPGFPLFAKELTVAASNCYGTDLGGSDFARGVELVTSHADRIDQLVTHTFELDDVAAAFATAGDKSTRAVKVQIRPDH